MGLALSSDSQKPGRFFINGLHRFFICGDHGMPVCCGQITTKTGRTMFEIPDGSILAYTSAAGIYIPQSFLSLDGLNIQGIASDEMHIVRDCGPDHPHYLDVWSDILAYAVVIADDGARYTLWHDEDLWLVPEDAEWEDDQ